MGLFERVANYMDEANQAIFDLKRFNKIESEIKREFSEITVGIQSDADTGSSEEFLAKTWELLHAAFFLKILAQPDPKHSLEDALSKFEPQIRDVVEKNMNSLERKSYKEFKRIIDISRRLVNSQAE